MTEDEKVAALEWARDWEHIPDELTRAPTGARALLDAVRLVRAHEYKGAEEWGARQCPECYGYSDEDIQRLATRERHAVAVAGHAEDCEVGSWVRAAQKAGVE